MSCTFTASSTATIILVNIIWPAPHSPCISLNAWYGYCFFKLTKTRLWKTPSAGRARSTSSGKFIFSTGRRIRTLADPSQKSSMGGLPTTVAG